MDMEENRDLRGGTWRRHPTRGMPLTLAELEEIQADLLADDVQIDFERMKLWDREKVVAYFENGGAFPESPLVVCLYSAGLTPAQGRSLMARMLNKARAAGLEDSLVLDHYTEYSQCNTFDEYIAALVTDINKKTGNASRAILLLAHSHGAVAAYGLARALGPRAKKLIICARRSVHGPAPSLLDEVWGVATTAEFSALSDEHILEGLVAAYKSIALAPHVKSPKSLWPEGIAETVSLARKLYTSPLGLCSKEDIVRALGSFEPPGGSPPLSLPIVALAAALEAPKGETGDKMRDWAKLTSGAFKLHTVQNVDHMGIVLNKEAQSIIVAEMTG